MDLEKEYNSLYNHWFKEFQQVDLTLLTQEQLKDYQGNLNFLKDFDKEGKDKIKIELITRYLENFDFLLKDLLKIREIKILNAALALQEINVNIVTEAEKLFYKNLISSIKGFEKLKALSMYESKEGLVALEELKPDTSAFNNIEIDQRPQQEIKVSDSVKTTKDEQKDYNYTLVRFLKKTPPLVGIDLINYGPFEKENIANLPSENANILIFEKFAERIELS